MPVTRTFDFERATGTVTDGATNAITTGGAAQTVLTANSARQFFFFQNISDEDMWINFGTAATQDTPSIKIEPGSSYEAPSHFVPSGLVSVISATTGKKFVCKEG